MKLDQFDMERMQSTWENVVEFNLSESGVHPLSISELASDAVEREHLLDIELGYSQSNGTAELRSAIAEMYAGAGVENVMVTSGTSEANLLVSWMLTEPGDEAVLMLPNYMQLWGLLRSFGAEVRPFHLTEQTGWSPDLDQLNASVSNRTRLIAVCNPNNPTGSILTQDEIDRIVEAASRVGAWILADEVYRGAERDGVTSPTFWGKYDRLIITAGLSKAYGLPGLRIGWIVAPQDVVATAWSYHDYTTIGPATASDFLARIALRPANRAALIERTRSILNSNYPIIRQWIDHHGGIFSAVDPKAGAIVYVRYDLDVNSLDFVEMLRRHKSVLLVPGAHFLMDKYLRIGYGSKPEHLKSGLDLIDSFILELSPRWT